MPKENRRSLILIGVLLLGLAGILWFNYTQQQQERPNLLTEQELRSLPDNQVEPRVINDIARRLVYHGYSPDAWRHLPQNEQHAWAVATVEEELSGFGFRRFLADQAKGSQGPGFSAAIAGYEAMGLAEVASILRDTQAYVENHNVSRPDANKDDRQALEAFLAKYLASLRDEGAKARRVAFLRTSLSGTSDR
jgi:hypothetical protein